jgi:archaellum component FlaC
MNRPIFSSRFWLLASGFSLLFLPGCASYSPEELERLTKEDAQFKVMIQARDQAHAQIGLIKQDLLQKKKLMDVQVEKLRSEYDAFAKTQNLKIEKFQSSIDTNRTALKREVESAGAQLAAKLSEIEGYQKTLADVKKVLNETKAISLSSQEKQKWEERAEMLKEKIRPLTDEIQELKLQIRLKKQKTGFLK